MKTALTSGSIKRLYPLLPFPALLLLFLLWVTLGSDPGGASVLGATAAAVVVGALVSSWIYLLPRFGKYTSVAVLSLATSLISTVTALVAPHCPGYATTTPRCGVKEVLNWALLGVGFPLLGLVLIFLLSATLVLLRSLRRLYRVASTVVTKDGRLNIQTPDRTSTRKTGTPKKRVKSKSKN